MDTLLVVVAMVAVVVAVGATAVAWHVVRTERKRAEARAAALSAAIASGSPASPVPVTSLFDASTGVQAPAEFLSEADTGPGALFGTVTVQPGQQRQTGPVLAVGALALAGLLVTFLVLAGGSGETAAPPAARPPVELLALSDSQDQGQLTIRGAIRNPANARSLERVTAVVFLFDRKGDFVASARAPLDFVTVAPGQEARFQASLATPKGVARYRVSFRFDDGAVIPHIDRRQE